MTLTAQDVVREAKSRIREIGPDELRALQIAGTPVIVYCRSGGRSALAADALRRLGFRQPLSLAGGFQAWLDAGQAIAGD